MELLEEYDFVVEHRRGTSHGNADALSRHPCLKKPSCTACHQQEDYTCASVTTSSERANDSVQQDSVNWTREELNEAQRQDPDLTCIVKLKETSTEKPSWDQIELQSAESKLLWHEWDHLLLNDGILYRKWTSVDKTTDRLQVVLPEKYRSSFIRLVHTGMTGGHLGRQKTEEQVQRRAYWPKWRSDVSLELKKCVECAQYHRSKPPRQTPLHPFNAGEPFEVIAIDVTGRHPKSLLGNEYIITVSCLFSRWAEAFPVRNHTAPTVAKVLVEQVFCRFGVPKRVLTDLGSEFQSQLFQEMCKKFEIDQVRTTAYQPRTNGQVERFHRTLNSMLGKTVTCHQRDWDIRLPFVMAAYRASRHDSTKYTPNMLVLGRENRAPADLVMGPVKGEEEHYDSYDDYVCELQSRMRSAHHLAREHLRTAAERRKEAYDVKVKDVQFKIGQWVWYLVPRKFVGRYPKWTKNYQGPYLVVNTIPPCDYLIQRSRRTAPIVVHGDKLKLCYSDTPPSWIQPGQQAVMSTTAPRGSISCQGVADRDMESPSSCQQSCMRPQGSVTDRVRRSQRRPLYQLPELNDQPRELPGRRRRPPGRFGDYVM